MRPIWHIIASLLLGIAIFVWSKSVNAAIAAFLVGVFIDLDHLPDFWALKPRHPFNVKDFLNVEKYDQQRKYIFIPLHGYEWLITLWFVSYWLGFPLVLAAILAAFSLHLFLDTYNLLAPLKLHPLTYFFFFRVARKFRRP